MSVLDSLSLSLSLLSILIHTFCSPLSLVTISGLFYSCKVIIFPCACNASANPTRIYFGWWVASWAPPLPGHRHTQGLTKKPFALPSSPCLLHSHLWSSPVLKALCLNARETTRAHCSLTNHYNITIDDGLSMRASSMKDHVGVVAPSIPPKPLRGISTALLKGWNDRRKRCRMHPDIIFLRYDVEYLCLRRE